MARITVRVPDELVAFVDEQVKTGQAKSRSQVVSEALLREKCRLEGLRDGDLR